MFKLLNAATAIGASPAIKVAKGVTDHTVDIELVSRAATAISAATVILQGSPTGTDKDTGVITNPTLAIGSTPERFANALFYYRIAGTNYTIAAEAAGTQFSAAHAVTAEKFGAINVYADTAGALSTKVIAATQAYDTAEEAHTAADTIVTPSNLCYLGRILINAESGNDWNGNTDDMTNGSDLTTATFISATSTFADLTTYALSAGEITAHRATFHTSDKAVNYVRVFLSALTGTGQVNVWYTPAEVY